MFALVSMLEIGDGCGEVYFYFGQCHSQVKDEKEGALRDKAMRVAGPLRSVSHPPYPPYLRLCVFRKPLSSLSALCVCCSEIKSSFKGARSKPSREIFFGVVTMYL